MNSFHFKVPFATVAAKVKGFTSTGLAGLVGILLASTSIEPSGGIDGFETRRGLFRDVVNVQWYAYYLSL